MLKRWRELGNKVDILAGHGIQPRSPAVEARAQAKRIGQEWSKLSPRIVITRFPNKILKKCFSKNRDKNELLPIFDLARSKTIRNKNVSKQKNSTFDCKKYNKLRKDKKKFLQLFYTKFLNKTLMNAMIKNRSRLFELEYKVLVSRNGIVLIYGFLAIYRFASTKIPTK